MTKSWYLIVRYRHRQKLCTLRERVNFNHLIEFLFTLPFTYWKYIQEIKIERLP